MWPNKQFPADWVTPTKGIFNGKLHFLCRAIALEVGYIAIALELQYILIILECIII